MSSNIKGIPLVSNIVARVSVLSRVTSDTKGFTRGVLVVPTVNKITERPPLAIYPKTNNARERAPKRVETLLITLTAQWRLIISRSGGRARRFVVVLEVN